MLGQLLDIVGSVYVMEQYQTEYFEDFFFHG